MMDEQQTAGDLCGCGDRKISHTREGEGPCIINGCECPGYCYYMDMPEWWKREKGILRPMSPQPDTDALAPLSSDELAEIEVARELVLTVGPNHVYDTREAVEAYDLIFNALPRLLAMAQREATLREAVERYCAAFEASSMPGAALIVGDLRATLDGVTPELGPRSWRPHE